MSAETTSPQTVVFRADSSLFLGSGHVIRCLTLASELRRRGVRCRFVCQELPGNLIARIEAEGFPVARLPAGVDDAANMRALLSGETIHWLVVDHYALGADWERAMRGSVGAILVIEDLDGRAHDCELLLDQNWRGDGDGADGAHANDVSDRCRRLIGPAYALLQPEYAAMRPLVPARSPADTRRVLIFFGGSDGTDETGKALAALSAPEFAALSLDVVLGVNHPAPAVIASQVAALPRATLHPPQRSLAGLLARADLAIGAGGSTSWERLCLKLPALVTTLADNQVPGTRRLADAGLVHFVGESASTTPADYARALRAGFALEGTRAPLVDGRGTRRVAEILAPTEAGLLRLRAADLEDADVLFAWRNEAQTRAMSFSAKPVSWRDHVAWLTQKLADSQCRLWIAEIDGLPIGQLRLQSDGVEVTLSYALDSLVRGRGWSRWLVGEAMRRAGPQRLVAQVKPENTASLSVFRRLGWRETGGGGHISFSFEGVGS